MTHTTSHAAAGPAPDSSAAAATRPAGRRVIDAPIRMFHWLFALAFVGAYLTGDGERWRALHVALGYTLGGLLAFRVVYGLTGPRQARLGALWRKLTAAPAWWKTLRRTEGAASVNWRQGQNLLMAAAMALLMALILPLVLSGVVTFHEWGDALGLVEAFEEVHEFFGNAMLMVVLGHLALIAGLSLLRRRNEAAPMLTGRSAGPGPDLVRNNRGWLAALLLASVLGYIAWEWQQAPSGLLPTTGAESLDHHDDDD
ncbi:cytochrome b/b6 domain-containing protein [Rhizobacter sp. LjRoot28]|uniref:cytochrome b/b6 domain-containing protein n=1 Tax=Rhizobacter sp. LjRoot28 TaxID=3342309 RepID=UPI003ECDBD02